MLLLYISDLPSNVHIDTHCHLFADCLLYRVVECFKDHVQLQSDLSAPEQRQWRITIFRAWGRDKLRAQLLYNMKIKYFQSKLYIEPSYAVLQWQEHRA